VRRRLLLCLGGGLLGLLCAEGALRWLGLPVRYQPRRTEGGDQVHGGLPDGTLIYRPNVVFSHIYDPAGDPRGYLGPQGRVTYHINQYGLRGPAVTMDKPPGTLRVLCLGDSITFGEGVHYQDTYPARLERLLSATRPERPVQVINGGVQAYGTRHALQMYEQLGRRFDPDVVILGFFLNDATDFYTTMDQFNAMTEGPSTSSLPQLWRTGALLTQVWYGWTVQRSYFQTTRDSFQSANWADCKQSLRRFQQLAQEDDSRFLVVVFPILWQLDAEYPFADLHALIATACEEAGCEHLDLLDTFRGLPAESLWAHPTDQHPNDDAHRRAAAAIARYLTNRANQAWPRAGEADRSAIP
jgi:lysophospholipase L1-like esterase